MPRLRSGLAVCAAITAAPIGRTTSAVEAGSSPENVAGITPTIAKTRPFSVIVLLVTVGSPPKTRCQKRWPIIATGAHVSGPSSSGSIVRPMAARTPSIRK
jgi:hypothetical protein